MKSCDPYLLELIASIDGAVLIDHSYNILSFGEMISSDETQEGKQYRGARTKAALSASRFGLGIKVSEDGDITIFQGKNELVRI
ncbi:diadenylate cyclase [Peribacillus frigoritolerans]|nr:diadenylate cyclase [Peribacillus frigoritolerans]